MTSPTPEEIAWAAGLFEGEGCFTASRPAAKPGYIQLVCRINMTDLDVLQTFYNIVPVGRLIEFTAKDLRHKSTKEMWTWYTTNAGDFAVVFMMLEPWLHERRKNKARELLQEWLNYKQTPGRRRDVAVEQKVARALDTRRD